MFFYDLIRSIKQSLREWRHRQWLRARRASITTPFD